MPADSLLGYFLYISPNLTMEYKWNIFTEGFRCLLSKK